MLLYLITVDVKFVHLVKLVSAFLHCQATIFSFVVGKYHGGDTLGQCKSFFFFYSNFHPLENFICNSNNWGINTNADFLVSSFLLHVLIRILL